jgi:hypothetical protein
MSKSHVTLEQHVCIVCGKQHDSGNILMDMRLRTVKGQPALRETFEHKTLTGWGLCEECKVQDDAGYVALVAVDPELSAPGANGNIKPEDAHRTGEVCHVRREGVWDRLFSIPAPDGPMCFVEPAVVEHLKGMMEEAGEEE